MYTNDGRFQFPDSARRFQAHEENMERAAYGRHEKPLFPEWQQAEASPAGREVGSYYAHQTQACGCRHDLGSHDVFMGRCMVAGCACKAFAKEAA